MPSREARNNEPVFPPGSTFSATLTSEKSPWGCHLPAPFHTPVSLYPAQAPTNGEEHCEAPRSPAAHNSTKPRGGAGGWGVAVRGLCPCKGCSAPQLSPH